MKKRLFAGFGLALFVVPLLGGGVLAGNPVELPLDVPATNQVSHWELVEGKGTDCVKQPASGGFQTVNRFDLLVAKSDVNLVWRPAFRGWKPAPGAVAKFKCVNNTPAPPPAVLNPYGQFYMCEGNKLWFEFNNTQSTRPQPYTGRAPTKNGPFKVSKTVPPLMFWRSGLIKVDLSSGQDAWINAGGFVVRRPVALNSDAACPAINTGFSYN